MLRNKHLIVALLVTPFLAILAWFAVGALVGEKPHRAVPGQSYPLVEASNCRYDSGQCDLHNQDMSLSISYAPGKLVLTSNQALERVLLAVAAGEEVVTLPEPRPQSLQQQDAQGLRWSMPVSTVPGDEQRLRIAAQAGGVSWFADTSTAFLASYREQLGNE